MPTARKKIALSPRDEEILKAVNYYRYVTAADITHLFFDPSSITHVREILANLCGGADLQTNNYLCRFQLPSATSKERVYVLGAKGGQYLAKQGIPTWRFRPDKLKFLSYSYLIHNLILTRFLVSSVKWSKKDTPFSLMKSRICYELAGKVIPDAWLLFEENTAEGVYEQPMILEIDRGMEYQTKAKAHIRERLEFVRSGNYARVFGTTGVTILYATTGQTSEYREQRRKSLCQWTMEILKERKMEEWARVFRFGSFLHEDIYSDFLFEKPIWYLPGSDEAVCLFS